MINLCERTSQHLFEHFENALEEQKNELRGIEKGEARFA